MEYRKIYSGIVAEIVKKSLEKYDLSDDYSINLFTNIARKTIEEIEYNPKTNLDENVFIKRSIIDNIDRFMVSLALDNKTTYKILESNLMKTLNMVTKINKAKFINISDKDKEYYKEYAILKTIETYDDNIKESLNIYVTEWFMAFINKEVNEDSKKLLIKSI